MLGLVRRSRACPQTPTKGDLLTVITLPTDRLLTTDDLARMTGLAPITLAHWRAAGTGPAHVKLGRAVRYRDADVGRWLSENTRVAA